MIQEPSEFKASAKAYIISMQTALTVGPIAATTGVVLALSKKIFRIMLRIQKNVSPRLMLPSIHKQLSLGALVILGLSSCSLPSEQAWREIRQEGLITYYQNKETPAAVKPATVTASPQQAVAKITSVPTTPSIASTTPTAGAMPTAQAVPGLEGYVRTPFTTPSRLVDVRGMAAGSKVICPYTRRPFLVPSMAAERQVVSTTAPITKPAPAPTVTTVPAPAPSVATAPLPQVPTKVAANTTPAPMPPPAPQTKPNPPVQQTPPEAPKPAVTADLPQGIAIPGRPGFVNSPFAAKHQLVDVTGLPTGMEVKCPYTGKLFRVPPQASTAPSN